MGSTDVLTQQAREAAQFLVDQTMDTLRGSKRHPIRFGIILGTGAGVLAKRIQTDVAVDYADIPHFPVSTALGHHGRLILGRLGNRQVVAMDGRFHLYEGHSLDRATLPIRAMRQLGVEFLFVTNASGGVNPKFESGDIMILTSHIDLMCRNSAATSISATEGRPDLRTDRYDAELMVRAERCARRNDFLIHRGTYGGLLGPNYETRAEYRMLRRIGADVAGMSTIPEVVVAAQLGLKTLGLSVITNVAKPDVLDPTSGQAVIDAAERAAPYVYKIVHDLVAELG